MSISEVDFIVKSKRRKHRKIYSNQTSSQIPESKLVPRFITDRYKMVIQSVYIPNQNYIIIGEEGTETKDIAQYISIERDPHSKFVEFIPQTYNPDVLQRVIQQVNQRNKYTILLSQFDLFSVEQKHSIYDILRRLSQQKLFGKSPAESLLLLVTTASLTDVMLHQLQQLASFAQLPVLPLRQRPLDVEALLARCCHEFRQFHEQRLSPDLYHYLLQHCWPGNVQQLRRCVARLFLFSSASEIELSSAQQLLPELFATPEEPTRVVPQQQLCQALLQQRLQWLDTFHPSVRKAMCYLSSHFRQELTLQELALNAHCSPSHLSYLLKVNFSISFKQLLNNLRVLYAQQQLRKQPQQRITDLSLDAGFSDLSHFEKMFKRYSGQTPNQFRKQMRPQQGEGYESLLC